MLVHYDKQDLPPLTPQNYINRELGVLAFQRRVLALAEDENMPLLERIKFISIVGSNLDEFFMVRVASYIQKVKLGIARARPDGITPAQLLRIIREQVGYIIEDQRRLMQDILEKLEVQGVSILKMSDLSEREVLAVGSYFDEEVYPVLTPLAVDHARPFPFISNLSLNLGVILEHIETDDEPEFARIKIPVPDILPRLVSMRKIMRLYANQNYERDHFLWIEDIICNELHRLFPGMRVVEACPFRVLRNADIDYEHELEEEQLDMKSVIEQSVRDRRFGSLVRVSVPREISQRMLERLMKGLGADPLSDVYTIEGALGSANLMELLNVDRPDLKDPPYVPRLPEIWPQGRDVFDVIRQQDIILHHPYDSFAPVEEFFRAAARDPDVVAIKTTLYRVGKNSPVVEALMEARDNDKQVTVLVELKARFDEENNLEWAQALERKGVHVIYGVEELPIKTHAKITLVVRREADTMRRYVHIGTGNYNAATARIYTDIGLFTCDNEIADDATKLFNRLTGFAPATTYKRLLVAPEYLQHSFISLIDNEIAAARSGKAARLIFKMNQLEEDVLIQKLYQASQAGVQIDLIVRGLCCLVPGLPNISETIRVRSIVGRFLEHGRIYYFENAPADMRVYFGSADLMRRNLLNRVEVVAPMLDARIQRRALRILAAQLRDNVNAWEMQSDGSYVRLQPSEGEERYDSQAIFMKSSYGPHEYP